MSRPPRIPLDHDEDEYDNEPVIHRVERFGDTPHSTDETDDEVELQVAGWRKGRGRDDISVNLRPVEPSPRSERITVEDREPQEDDDAAGEKTDEQPGWHEYEERPPAQKGYRYRFDDAESNTRAPISERRRKLKAKRKRQRIEHKAMLSVIRHMKKNGVSDAFINEHRDEIRKRVRKELYDPSDAERR